MARTDTDIAGLSFESALKRLEDIVNRLERGEVPLEESIALYETGARLKAHCEAKLKDAELKVQQIVLTPDGKPQGVKPFDVG